MNEAFFYMHIYLNFFEWNAYTIFGTLVHKHPVLSTLFQLMYKINIIMKITGNYCVVYFCNKTMITILTYLSR